MPNTSAAKFCSICWPQCLQTWPQTGYRRIRIHSKMKIIYWPGRADKECSLHVPHFCGQPSWALQQPQQKALQAARVFNSHCREIENSFVVYHNQLPNLAYGFIAKYLNDQKQTLRQHTHPLRRSGTVTGVQTLWANSSLNPLPPSDIFSWFCPATLTCYIGQYLVSKPNCLESW